MAVVYRCRECRTKIRSEDGTPPDDCPVCSARVASDRPDDDVVMPFVRSSSDTKRTDQVVRDMEKGSEIRAQIAADNLGVPVAEMSDMKITNLNDRRDAEIAAIPVVNDITRHMAATGMNGFGTSIPGQPSPGAEYAQGTSTGAVTVNGKVTHGIEPRAGARAHAGLQRLFGK